MAYSFDFTSINADTLHVLGEGMMVSLKITATAAVVGAIVGEFVASQRGLGYVIITSQSSMNTPVAFAALVWISILGLVLFALVAWLARVLAPWAGDL